MCGISAVKSLSGTAITEENSLLESQLRASVSAIGHRGPDSFGIYVSDDGSLGLAHARLSIIDLEGGQQPLHDSSNSIHAIVNGEFYDYADLRKTLESKGCHFRSSVDSELVIHLYQIYGQNFIHYLRGEFAFILYDSKRQFLMAARDRFGIKPLYHTVTDGKLMLASEMKALLPLGWKAEWDIESIMQMCEFSDDRTVFRGIYKMPAGHLLTCIHSGRIEVRPYWDLEYPHAAVEDARVRLRSDVPWGVYLSGGIDSASVAGIASALLKEKDPNAKLMTFTLAFPGRKELDEGPIARRMAESIGAIIHMVTPTEKDLVDQFPKAVYHTEQPTLSFHGTGKMILSEYVRDNGCKVVLTGEGSDEIFGGYYFFIPDFLRAVDPAAHRLGFPLPNETEIIAAFDKFESSGLRQDHISTRKVSFQENQLGRDLLGGISTHVMVSSSGLSDSAYPQLVLDHTIPSDPTVIASESISLDARRKMCSGQWHPLHSALYTMTKTGLRNIILNGLGDRAEMANSIEGRTPFLDHYLVEYVNNLPPSVKIMPSLEYIHSNGVNGHSNGVNGHNSAQKREFKFTDKWILRQAVKPFVTKEIYSRAKMQYNAPLSQPAGKEVEHEYSPLQRMLQERLTKQAVVKLGWVRWEYVEGLLREYLEAPGCPADGGLDKRSMPRRARIHFVSLRSSLVNLPISIYGPLLERSIRPQSLAVHLTLVPSSSKSSRIEAYVGWTGMASASSLAQFNSTSTGAGEKGLETIEIDPQHAQGLGFSQGDTVEIGLVYDMAVAKSVGTEPLTSDDWEIIEIHASHVESTLLSQVRVARINQEIDVWVLGRTRVRLKVVSLDPQTKDNALLLSTNTEVSIAPKAHKRQPRKSLSSQMAVSETKPQQLASHPNLRARSIALRVLPSRLSIIARVAYDGPEVLAFVSPNTFSKLYPGKVNGSDSKTFYRIIFNRLRPPTDPMNDSMNENTESEPATKILNPGEQKSPSRTPSAADELTTVYLRPTTAILNGHIVFATLPGGVEDWDLVRIIATPDERLLSLKNEIGDIQPSLINVAEYGFLAGVDDILKQCTDFCIRKLAIHGTKANVRGVSSLLITGRAGVGKTSIIKCVANALQENPKTLTYTLYVDVAPLAEKPVATVKTLFKFWFDKAFWHKPTLLVLDNLHELLGTELEHTDSFRTRHIAELFLSIFSASQRAAASNARGIIMLATAPSAAALHPLISTAHVFEEVVSVTPPNKDARRDILSKLVQKHLNHAADLRQDPVTPLNFTYLATQTEGYSATDLQDLVSRAVHQVVMKMTLERKDPVLTMTDFEDAKAGFVPLSLRDIKLEKSETSWSDIGGLQETKRVLRETLEWPTKYGPIFAQSPLRLRSGLLLYGYPGCGKTLLASAVAKECGLNFIGVKGPEILNKYIGESEKTVRDIFERASSAKPCILFFDEFDSIAPKRGHDSTGVTDRVVNQLLTQMDGAEGLEGVYVLAATSRPDLIDSALLRPGRLDKSLLCNMPDFEERKDILQAVSRKVKVSASVDFASVAEVTDGFSGADLQALIYNAHLEVVNASIAASSQDASTFEKQEDPVKFNMFGGPNQSEKAISKAELAALQRRLRQVQLASMRPTMQRTKVSKTAESHESREIMQEHIRRALRTTRPSVSMEERRRLDRIYSAFIDDRSGELPVPPDSTGVGNRASLA
ncbi:likely peroxisomal biogenesis aaa atpase pex1 [Moniliophthora roreri MCA 2997]|uniref:Peroxisomal ATPase PEX1 n=1 Tax=Moniliophthora roreri (strain MCA 2997) TaxID=1381753 RepID=V2XMH0_MONRO|nr:likely peroxisomal biogenesis aaa atpase pex1 [Moniliophthora roreri MCA 2997]